MAGDVSADVVVVMEAELSREDVLIMVGYNTFLPFVLQLTRVCMVVFVEKSLHAEQLPSPKDVPVVIIRISSTAVIGVYRQFVLPRGASDTVRGLSFEIE